LIRRKEDAEEFHAFSWIKINAGFHGSLYLFIYLSIFIEFYPPSGEDDEVCLV
jgi:hypothetical protein